MLINTHFNNYLFATKVDNSYKLFHIVLYLKVYSVTSLPTNKYRFTYTYTHTHKERESFFIIIIVVSIVELVSLYKSFNTYAYVCFMCIPRSKIVGTKAMQVS